MKKENFNHPLRQYAHARQASPPPEVWNNISAKLQRDKTAGFFWWLSRGAGFLFIAFFVMMLVYLQNGKEATKASLAANAPTSYSAAAATEAESMKTVFQSPEENTSTIAPAHETAETLINQKQPALDGTSEPASAFAATITPSKNAIYADKHGFVSIKENTTNDFQNFETAIEPEKEMPYLKAADKVIQGKTKTATEANSESPTKISGFKIPLSLLATNEVELWNLVDDYSIHLTEEKEELQKVPPRWRRGVHCFDFRSGNQPVYYVDILGGGGILQRRFVSREQEFDSYLALRDSTESAWYSINGGVRAGIVRGGFTADLGLRYRQLNEVFSGKRENEEQITINTIRDDAGNIIATDTILELGSRTRETGNAFRQFEIPLRLGYLVSSKRWSAGANIGASYIFSSHRKGLIYSPGGLFYDIATDENAYYHNNGFWRAGAGAFIMYHPAPQWGIFLEPEAVFDLQTLNTPDYPIDQRYRQYSIQMGLRYFIR